MTSAIVSGAVIAAVDGSLDSRRGVRWAAGQAHLERRPLVLVHATGGDNGGATTWQRLDDSISPSQILVQEAVAFAEERYPDLAVRGVSVPDDARSALIDLSMAAHLLVLGSRGRGPVRSKLLGSVSAKVAKCAACPVVVTRPTQPGAIKDGVVVGADGTVESLPVIEFAFRHASLHGLPLTVMHCVDAPAGVVGARGSAFDIADMEERQVLLAESVAGLSERYPDVRVRAQLNRGLIEECLMSGPRPWNLIVVGRHPIGHLRSSASTAVLERSHSVVAVVPEAATSG